MFLDCANFSIYFLSPDTSLEKTCLTKWIFPENSGSWQQPGVIVNGQWLKGKRL